MFKGFISADNRKRLLGSALLLLLQAGWLDAADSSLTVVGAYSNRVVTGDSAKGYDIQLWQEGGLYFGFFQSAGGLAEDPPIGILEDLRYDPRSNRLTFRARLSVGVTTIDGDSWVPTRDVYQFDGTLFPDQISGSLVHLDAFQPERPGINEEVKLYRSKKEEAGLIKPASYKEWSEYARQVLQARGPKW